MPVKLTFRVISATSQSNMFKAEEIIKHSPTSKGWQSGNFCIYPQEIMVELYNRSHLKKIQLLSHQYLIATKIEFFIGDCSNSSDVSLSTAKFSRLGYVSMSNNEKTQYKARELKSVHVDAVGRFLKLVIHKNYINKHNHYNQVGIIALNIIGDDIYSLRTDETENIGSGIKSDIISPTDDLAFDMRLDPDTADIIRKLESQKIAAVNNEQFDKAQEIKEKIAYLIELGEMIGKLEIEKKSAVEKQNYERAQLKKQQIRQYRENVYRELDLLEMLNNRHKANVTHPISSPLNQNNNAAIMDEQPPPPPLVMHSDRYSYNNEDRPLPALKNKQPADVYTSRTSQLDNFVVNPPNASIPSPIPASQESDADTDDSKIIPGMTKSDISEASDAIEVYGMPLVSKVYSKNWSHREDALLEVKKRLEELQSDVDKEDIKAELKAVACLLKKSFKSRMTQVIQVAVTLNRLVLVDLVERLGIAKPEIHSYLDKIVPELFRCTEDMKVQIRELAYPHIIEMSEWESVNHFHHIYQNSIKPFGTNVLAKEGLIRSQLLMELYAIHGLCNSYYTLDNFMKYAVTALEHKSAEVRESADTLIVVLYRNEDKAVVRSYLPPDDAKTRKNLLYKRLFEKLDKIDGIDPNNSYKQPVQQQQQQQQKPQQSARKKQPITNARSNRAEPTPRKMETSSPAPEPISTPVPVTTAANAADLPNDDDIVPYDESVCIFCGERNADFVKNIDLHYWKYCPLLRRCPHCKQAVEISLQTQHLLQECDQASQFSECPRCAEAISNSEFEQHVNDSLCNPAPQISSDGQSRFIRCPLCHENVPLRHDNDNVESLWQFHLMDRDKGCQQNPRRLVAIQRQRQQSEMNGASGGAGNRGQNKGQGGKQRSMLPKAKGR